MTICSDGSKRVCIIGAGPLGLSAAYYLSQANSNNLHVTVIEASSGAGGLAGNHRLANSECIESYYHHIFSSDKSFISLCKELGLDAQLFFRKASTGHYFNSKLHSMSGPIDILTGPLLSPVNRIRFLLASLYLKSGIKKVFPGQSAMKAARVLYGSQCTERIWEPLLVGKYSNYKDLVPMSWLASRIRDRSIKLGYIEGGFDRFYSQLADRCSSSGVNIHYSTRVNSLCVKSDYVTIDNVPYDACLSTIGPVNEGKIHQTGASDVVKYLGAICVVYEFSEDPGLPYWTNYCDTNSPVLAVISHRRLDISLRFGSCYPVYSAAYVLPESDLLTLSDSDIISLFYGPIEVIANAAKGNTCLSFSRAVVYRTKYAQPVINPDLGLPPILGKNGPFYRASMHSIYPNDRGQNYAIDLGKKMARRIIHDQKIDRR